MNRIKIAVGIISFLLAVFCFSAPSFAAEKFNVAYDKSIDLTEKSVTTVVDGYNVTADMSRPAEPFKEIMVRVFIDKDKKPVNLSHGYVLFNMSMDMGLYKAKLQKANTGYTAKITLPKCMFGGQRWFAKVVFGADGAEHQKVLIFDMKE